MIFNIHYGDILTKYGAILDVQTATIPYIVEGKLEEFKNCLLQEGDIVIADTAEDETAGKTCEVSNLQGAAIVAGLHTVVGRPKIKMAIGYLGYYLNSGVYRNQLIAQMQGIKVLSLSRHSIRNTKVGFPITKEQACIAGFLFRLDSLLSLHQRKLEKLKILRKAMLEKMFPKNGTKVPEIRFSGFTEDWEQRKLGEIAEKVSEKNFGMQYSLTLTNSAEFGVIAQRDFFDHDIAKASSLNGYYVVHNEDFVYNPRISVSAPVGPINRNKLGETGVMSPLYTVFRPHDINATYLEYFFKSGYWHKFMNFNGDSGARADRFSIKDQVFFEMPIPFPNPIEQRKIGNYLKRLDSLLSLHQRKLEKLRQIKKSMLERMFV